MKKRHRFPPGWNDARVQRVLEHYETQSDVEAVAEDEAGVPIDNVDGDEDTGQARSGGQSPAGEAPGQLIDARPNMACSQRRDESVRAAAGA